MPRGYGGVVNPMAGVDLSGTLGQTGTAQSLAEWRKRQAAIDPNFQFGPMSAYGLSGTAPAEQQVSDYARAMGEQRLARENAMTNMLNAQYLQATGQLPGAQPAAPEKKKGGFLRTLGKIGLAAAPIVAGALIPGAGSVLAQSIIGGLSGAGQGALQGGGVKGAILGGATGAAAGGFGAAKAPNLPTGLSAGQRVQQALLNPAAVTRIAGAATPGPAGNVIQALSPFMSNKPFFPSTGPTVQTPTVAATATAPANKFTPPSSFINPEDPLGIVGRRTPQQSLFTEAMKGSPSNYAEQLAIDVSPFNQFANYLNPPGSDN